MLIQRKMCILISMEDKYSDVITVFDSFCNDMIISLNILFCLSTIGI